MPVLLHLGSHSDTKAVSALAWKGQGLAAPPPAERLLTVGGSRGGGASFPCGAHAWQIKT